MGFFDIFVYAPFVVFALVVPAFVMRCGFSPVTKAVWAAVLFLSLLKFWFFRTFGGHPFNPEFHEAVIIAWDVAHTGAVILCALSVVFFWRFRGRGTVLPVVALLTALAGVICGVVVPGVKEVRLEYPGLPDSLDGFRIVHVTDLHCSSSARRSRTEAVVAKVNALKADVICLTGDYADGYAANRGMDLEPIKDLKAKRGVFFVTGNHEYYRDYAAWREWYAKNGIRFLSNECVFPCEGLAIGGVEDFAAVRRGGNPPDVHKAFAAATNGEFRVLLQHQPRTAAANIREAGVDLQLSGHTHGGVAPLLRNIIARWNGGFSFGVYRIGDGILYVSPGAGQWAGFLCRFFNPSEITLLELRGKKGMDANGG